MGQESNLGDQVLPARDLLTLDVDPRFHVDSVLSLDSIASCHGHSICPVWTDAASVVDFGQS